MDCCNFEEFQFAPRAAKWWRLFMIDNWGVSYSNEGTQEHFAIDYVELRPAKPAMPHAHGVPVSVRLQLRACESMVDISMRWFLLPLRSGSLVIA